MFFYYRGHALQPPPKHPLLIVEVLVEVFMVIFPNVLKLKPLLQPSLEVVLLVVCWG